MPVPSLEQLATAAVAARLAREPDAYLPRVVAAAPLSLVSPCLSGLRDPLALAAVEDATFCDDEEEERRAGKKGASLSSSARGELLEVHWQRLFLERFGAASGGKDCSDDVANGTRWRHRYEEAEAAERRRLEALGARLREREREEEARKRARAVVVLAAPPRPQTQRRGFSSSVGSNISKTKKSSVDARQRIEKKLASGLRRKTAATATAKAAPTAKATSAAAAAARAPSSSSSSFPNLARPLVRPGNEAERRIVRKVGTTGSGGVRAGASKAVELEEVSLFD